MTTRSNYFSKCPSTSIYATLNIALNVSLKELELVGKIYSIHALYYHQGESETLLSTALIKIRDIHGNFQLCRLDSGSQHNFIFRELLKRLNCHLSRPRSLSQV